MISALVNTWQWDLHLDDILLSKGWVCFKLTMTNLVVWSVRGQGQAVLPFFIWLHSVVILFYPTLSYWCNSLNKKVQKELYERRQQQIGDEDVFLKIFTLFAGFNNHSMGEGIFSKYNWSGWINQSRSLKIR